MKLLLIIQLLVGCLFLCLDAKSEMIDCSRAPSLDFFSCSSIEHNITINNVLDIESAKKIFNLIEPSLLSSMQNQSMDFDSFLQILSRSQPEPNLNGWNLPTFTLIALQNKGITDVNGRSIKSLIKHTENVHWQDFFFLDSLNNFKAQRHTGFYNSLTHNIVYDGLDLNGRDISDIQHWALHEVFGTANIQDKNYELSTLATLVTEGFLSGDEFNKMQYTNQRYQLPLKRHAPKRKIPTKTVDYSYEVYDREKIRQEGGITGVEGGGDIVSASIKRYMILAIKYKLDENLRRRDELIKRLMSYDIHYTDYDIFFKPTREVELETAPIYKGFENGVPLIIFKRSIRKEWPRLNHQEKLNLGRRYLEFINFGMNQIPATEFQKIEERLNELNPNKKISPNHLGEEGLKIK